MAGKALDVKVDVRQVERLADKLGRLSGDAIGQANVEALNKTIDSAYELARERMNAGINLDDQYLRRRMTVRPATAGRPVATLTTEGSHTRLSRFSAQTVTRATKTPATRLKGYPGLGIAAGSKPAGVTIAVSKGSRKLIRDSNVFVSQKFKDSEGNPLVMRRLEGQTRSGKDRLQSLLGPSPYQLFAYQLPTVSYAAEQELEEALVAGVGAAIEKALTP